MQPPLDRFVAARRIAELRLQADENIREQHVVSRVVLKQWTDHTRCLNAVSVTDRAARVIARGPAGLGKITDFVPRASRSAEERWAMTERHVPRLVRLCNTDAILDEPDAAATLRDLVALHFVRNRSFWRVHVQGFQHERKALKRRARTFPGYAGDFLRRFGRPPLTSEDHDFYFEMVLARRSDLDFYSGLTFRYSVERMFDRCRAWMADRQIQIIHPSSGEFLIGDAPVVVLDRTGRLEPGVEVALGNASQILMPVTPWSLVAFGPTATGEVAAHVVDELNTFQIRAAHTHAFVRPGSELEEFVRITRFGSTAATA
ncbi:DUF4238 domain-containing protein [Verrucosispora sp. WMMD703]|uniref:DUF4238 domain-containing protein n=1 Tax=Verrucosispora sp. WMMD703 TaxID=3403463 RepID=UPI003B93FB80